MKSETGLSESGWMHFYVKTILRYRRLVVLCVLSITIVFGVMASRIVISIDREHQLPQDHALVKIDNRITNGFGGARIVEIAVVAKSGDIYQPAILEKIRGITAALEQMRGVIRSNLLSIGSVRVRAIVGTADGMEARPLMDGSRLDARAIKALREKIAGQPVYTSLLVSKDAKTAAILVDFREGVEDYLRDTEIHRKIDRIVTKYSDDSVDIHIAGMPIWLSYLNQFARDMAVYFALAVLIIALIHYEAFRTLQAALLPLVTALVSVVWSLGWLGMLGLPMDTWNSMTPILVLAVAAGHAVQILKRYYEEYEKVHDNDLAVVRAVTQVGPPMVAAGIIASLGFASLAVFDIHTVRVFGLVSAAGILSAVVLEMTLIPAIRSMLPAPRKGDHDTVGRSIMSKTMDAVAQVVVSRPGVVVSAWTIVVIGAVAGATTLSVNNSFNAALPGHHPYRAAEKVINRDLGGANTMSILIDTHRFDGIKSPQTLIAINELEEYLAAQPGVGATQSIVDYIKRMNQAMHSDIPAYFRIPESQAAVEQNLFVYSLSGDPDDFGMIVDSQYQRAIIRVFAKMDEHRYTKELLDNTAAKALELFPKDITVDVAGGTLATGYALNETIIWEKMLNVLQILSIVFIISAFLFRSMAAGLFILIPSTLAMIVSLGVMGIAGIPISLGTAATSALTVSIGADYAIYLMFRFKEESIAHADPVEQIRQALLNTGKAVFYVATAIAAGYSVLMFTGLLYYRQLGGLVAFSMLISALAAVTLLPAILLYFRPKFTEKIRLHEVRVRCA